MGSADESVFADEANTIHRHKLGQEIEEAYAMTNHIQLEKEEESPSQTVMPREELSLEIAEASEMAKHMDPYHLIRAYIDRSMLPLSLKHRQSDEDDIEAEAPQPKRAELEVDDEEMRSLLLECRRLGSLYVSNQADATDSGRVD
ncbi:unnamed protein product [Peniophora sp. CBMAI 1063]|nr:unnamed protein product [Peniophora sp. CBMAI 1063]